MTRTKVGLAFVAGALIGAAGAVTGYVLAGLPGELAGIFVGWSFALVVGIWIGFH